MSVSRNRHIGIPVMVGGIPHVVVGGSGIIVGGYPAAGRGSGTPTPVGEVPVGMLPYVEVVVASISRMLPYMPP